MKRKKELCIGILIIVMIFIALLVGCFLLKTNIKFFKAFHNCKGSFDEFVEYLYVNSNNLTNGRTTYYVISRDNKYYLSEQSINSVDEMLYYEEFEEIEQLFEKFTHNANIDYIYVEDNYVILQSEYYGGSMIYSSNGRLGDELKHIERYQRLIRLDRNWYAVFVNLL